MLTHTLEIFIIALVLSIDAFAVAISAAASGRVSDARSAIRLAFHFGLFQFLMPILGWSAGATLEPFMRSFDHWVAFLLLLIVGIRMVRASRKPNKNSLADDPSRGFTLMALSTAVSIDALAVGLSLAMLQVSIWTPSVIIGLITAAMSLVGCMMGARLHTRFGRTVELAGGIALILVAIRLVILHELSL